MLTKFGHPTVGLVIHVFHPEYSPAPQNIANGGLLFAPAICFNQNPYSFELKHTSYTLTYDFKSIGLLKSNQIEQGHYEVSKAQWKFFFVAHNDVQGRFLNKSKGGLDYQQNTSRGLLKQLSDIP